MFLTIPKNKAFVTEPTTWSRHCGAFLAAPGMLHSVDSMWYQSIIRSEQHDVFCVSGLSMSAGPVTARRTAAHLDCMFFMFYGPQLAAGNTYLSFVISVFLLFCSVTFQTQKKQRALPGMLYIVNRMWYQTIIQKLLVFAASSNNLLVFVAGLRIPVGKQLPWAIDGRETLITTSLHWPQRNTYLSSAISVFYSSL